MNFEKYRSRLERFKSNPKAFLKTFYYMKIVGVFNSKKRKDSYKEYFDEIPLFAQNYLVNSMRIGEEYIWPYLRNHLWVNLNSVAIGKGRGGILPYALQNGHYSQIPPTFREDIKKELDAVEIDDIAEEKIDFLFFVNINGTEQLNIDGKIYHRITDPFYEEALRYGTAMKIEMVKNNSETIQKWHNYKHKSQLILPPEIHTHGYHHKLSFDGRFFSLFKKHVPSLQLSNRVQLNNIINHEIHTRNYYIDLLRQLKPKVICLHGFHYQAPLISAADELGIITVDLQHGLQVGWNPLYNNYDELPISGYQALPDYFAVWGEKEYNNILKTFKSKKHKPIYMGNPWLKKIETFSHPISDRLEKKLIDDKTKILIIMQNQPSIPKLFVDIINNTGDDILWIVRHHPKGEKYKAKDFSRNKTVLVDEEIDHILFNELFKHVDIAISEGSALALEASHYGVHNIITSEMGQENYSEEIATGTFHYLDDANEFRSILTNIQTFAKKKTYKPFKDVDLKDFFTELLTAAKRKTVKKDPLKLTILPPKDHRKKVSKKDWIMSLQSNSNETEQSILTFNELRKLLDQTHSSDFLYEREQNIWIKEAKILQRHIKNSQKNANANVVMVTDSLGLPRPHEVAMKDFGVQYTSTYMFNDSNNTSLSMQTWAQRFLTTEKLLNNWNLMTQSIENKHLVIHLGLNDSAERIFLERQRLSLTAYNVKTRQSIVAFGKQYRKEIISNQKDHSYVPFEQFKTNLDEIVRRSIQNGVASLTFINIIAFPASHEKNTPGSLANTKRFNQLFVNLQEKYPHINLIDLDMLIKENGFKECMLEDNMHLSHKGHRLLANSIISALRNIEIKG